MYAAMMKIGNPLKGNFHATVDYDIPIEELVKGGRCGCIASEISCLNLSSNKKGRGIVDAKNVYLQHRPILGDSNFEWEMACLKKRGYEPVNLQEMITIFNSYNIMPRKMIMALGTIIESEDGMFLSAVIRKGGYLDEYIVGLEEV